MDFTANLDSIILYVHDVPKLKSFYCTTFNLKIVEEHESLWVLLGAGNTKIGLHKIGDQYLQADSKSYKFHSNTKVVFEINQDLTTVRTRFINQGIPMREIKTFDNYDFWLCDGEDPEGNVFQLKQKKLNGY